MANEKNLKPIRTAKEAREKGRKGGIKSGEKRREQRKFKEIFETLLSKKSTNDKGETATIKEVIAINTIAKAVKGDIKPVHLITSILDENKNKDNDD